MISPEDPETDPNLADPSPPNLSPQEIRDGILAHYLFRYNHNFVLLLADISKERIPVWKGLNQIFDLHIAFMADLAKLPPIPTKSKNDN